jgi:heme exporter protein CcmD
MMTHGFFIWSSYLISGAVLIGLTLYLLFDGVRLNRLLAQMEAQNTPRRPRGPAQKTKASRKTK